MPDRLSARQRGSKATYRAPPRLPGVGLLGCAAAGSIAVPAGEGSLFPAPAVPLAAREGTAVAAAAAAAATGTAAAGAAVPLGMPYPLGKQECQAFKGGGGSSLLHLQPHSSSPLWGAASGGAQHEGAARAMHEGAEAGTGKRKVEYKDRRVSMYQPLALACTRPAQPLRHGRSRKTSARGVRSLPQLGQLG